MALTSGTKLGPYEILSPLGTGEIPSETRDLLLDSGTKLGPYEILSPLGAGGMGEVEPFCGRERSGSPQAKSRVKRGICC